MTVNDYPVLGELLADNKLITSSVRVKSALELFYYCPLQRDSLGNIIFYRKQITRKRLVILKLNNNDKHNTCAKGLNMTFLVNYLLKHKYR